MESQRYNITRLANLIKEYYEYESGKAASEIYNMNIEGDELIDALDTARINLEVNTTQYEELEEKHKTLRYNLEKLIKGKEGKFIEKIKDFLKEVD